MKVPFNATQSHHPNSNVKLNDTARNTSYEPKSVLDLSRSPSPSPVFAAAGKAVPKVEFSESSDALLQSDSGCGQWDEHPLHNLEDWDSLIKELGLHDDSAPVLKPLEPVFQALPEFQFSQSFDSNPIHPLFIPSDFAHSDVSSNQIMGSFNFGADFNHMNQWDNVVNFLDELIRAVDSLESNDIQLAQVILARLNQQLPAPVGKPLQRAAFYFKEALQCLLTGSIRQTRPTGSSDVVQAIKAHKSFSNVSPVAMFSNFTANQAILEAVDGSSFVHVIDFDIGFGGQWASFMKEIADRAESRKANKPVLRITAVVPEGYALESKLIRDNMTQFARELKIGFDIEFVSILTFEFLSFKSIKFMNGEKTAVLLSPTIFQHIGAGFLNDLRQISPQVVVVVDAEGLTDSRTPSLRRSVIDGLEFYSTVLESLEAASTGCGDDWIRRIEKFLLRPKIFAAVEAVAMRRSGLWREAFAAGGWRPVGLSQFADFQADWLLRKVQVRGFHVAKRQAEMVLCWQDRALVATSAWRC
ncbi:scarecrow-like protein 15 [Diospyros lotus]|uniref:scarecrow-like protein 15 n=1 Tax=Diospyros lotus TaxID=55363 RepID=UPI0022562E22|nr:scarecrow-like protein 15 [Diospyros lotus]